MMATVQTRRRRVATAQSQRCYKWPVAEFPDYAAAPKLTKLPGCTYNGIAA